MTTPGNKPAPQSAFPFSSIIGALVGIVLTGMSAVAVLLIVFCTRRIKDVDENNK